MLIILRQAAVKGGRTVAHEGPLVTLSQGYSD